MTGISLRQFCLFTKNVQSPISHQDQAPRAARLHPTTKPTHTHTLSKRSQLLPTHAKLWGRSSAPFGMCLPVCPSVLPWMLMGGCLQTPFRGLGSLQSQHCSTYQYSAAGWSRGLLASPKLWGLGLALWHMHGLETSHLPFPKCVWGRGGCVSAPQRVGSGSGGGIWHLLSFPEWLGVSCSVE